MGRDAPDPSQGRLPVRIPRDQGDGGAKAPGGFDGRNLIRVEARQGARAADGHCLGGPGEGFEEARLEPDVVRGRRPQVREGAFQQGTAQGAAPGLKVR